MRKKNLKVQVAALAVTGVIAATPLSVRADETGNPAAISTEAGSSTAAPDTGTVTPAATGVASTSTASTTTPAAGTEELLIRLQQHRLRVPEPPLRQAELQAV